MSDLLGTIICSAILLALSGAFSGAETALFSLTRSELKRMSDGTKAERTICELLRKPQHLLSTILICNTLVNVLLTSFFAGLLLTLFKPESGWFPAAVMRLMPGASPEKVANLASVAQNVLNIAIVTPLLMIFGEQTPKVVAYALGPSVARKVALPLGFLSRLLTPATWILRTASNGVMMLMGQRIDEWDVMTTDELLANIAASGSTQDAQTSQREQRVLRGVVELGDLSAREVMVPRTGVEGVKDTLTLRQAFEQMKRNHHSWYPVCRGHLDEIWGVLSLGEYPYWRGRPEMEQPLSSFRAQLDSHAPSRLPVHPPRFIPKTAPADRLLVTMRREGCNIVVVLDEYGGTAGIVTTKDLTMELLGRMGEENMRRPPGKTPVSETFPAHTRLRLLEQRFGNAFANASVNADTLAGMLMERLERMPALGDFLVLEDGTRLEVAEMDGRLVKSVLVQPPPVPNPSEEEP
ncbi:MAG: HlyC/CorC family transporter [Victivallales bacterium]|nr:HlyC/CorC family transporter [Victivallales bacterium]